MYFIDRTALGDKLAGRLQQFHGKDAVVVCLQESSLLTCITIASQIRAWVYPLIYEPVYSPDHSHIVLGAFDVDGEFCPNEVGTDGKTEISADLKKIIKKQRSAALKSIKAQSASYGMAIDKQILNGRDVILAADVVTNTMPLLMARQLLKDVTPRSLTAVVGNVTPEVAQLVRISAGTTDILDIMSGVVFDEDRYFERADTYTTEQKHTLTQHIAAYWQ